MGVTFDPLQGPRVFRHEFNPGNHGFPPLPFLYSNGVANPAYGLKNYLFQSIPFSPLMDRNLFFLKKRAEGCLSIYFLNISVQFFLFNLNLFYHLHPAGKAIERGKNSRIGSPLYTFSYTTPYKISKKMPGKFFQLPGILLKRLADGKIWN